MSSTPREVHPANRIHPDLGLSESEDYEATAVGYVGTMDKSVSFPAHSHRRAQLFHIVSGSVTVETDQGTFVIPPERALWIPPNVVHSVTYLQQSALRYLFFRPEAVGHLPAAPAVIRLSPLLRELALELLKYPPDQAVSGPAGRIVSVILDQLATEPAAPLHLPLPNSPRLRRAVAVLVSDPARPEGVADAARRAAFSQRSFERHFRLETGLSYRDWRRQARLMKAVELLSLHVPVSDVADRLGYEGPSSFIATFRKAFGVTPGRYFADQ